MAPCRVELSDDEADDDLEGESENYICTLLDEDGWECGQRWPTARALAAHQRHTQRERMEKPKGMASLVVTNQCFWCGSTHASIETTSKHMAAEERHNRCVVDAGRFHYPVIDIPPDTICPRCDLIFNDTAELQRHLASMEYPPPEGHSLVINAETSVGACGDLWQKIRDRWRARRAERETKTHQIATWRDDGRRGDGRHELGAEGSAKGANKSTDAKLHNAVLKTLCVLSQQGREVGGAVFMCWMIKQEAPEYKKPKRAIARLLGTGGDQGQGSRPRSSRDSGFHGPVASAVGERQHSGSGKRGWSGKPQANVGRHATGGGFRFGTSLQAGQSVRPSSEPSRTRHRRGTTPRSHSWSTRTNRSESSSRSSSKRSFWNGHCQQRSNRIEKSEFCCIITSRLTNQTPIATG